MKEKLDTINNTEQGTFLTNLKGKARLVAFTTALTSAAVPSVAEAQMNSTFQQMEQRGRGWNGGGNRNGSFQGGGNNGNFQFNQPSRQWPTPPQGGGSTQSYTYSHSEKNFSLQLAPGFLSELFGRGGRYQEPFYDPRYATPYPDDYYYQDYGPNHAYSRGNRLTPYHEMYPDYPDRYYRDDRQEARGGGHPRSYKDFNKKPDAPVVPPPPRVEAVPPPVKEVTPAPLPPVEMKKQELCVPTARTREVVSDRLQVLDHLGAAPFSKGSTPEAVVLDAFTNANIELAANLFIQNGDVGSAFNPENFKSDFIAAAQEVRMQIEGHSTNLQEEMVTTGIGHGMTFKHKNGVGGYLGKDTGGVRYNFKQPEKAVVIQFTSIGEDGKQHSFKFRVFYKCGNYDKASEIISEEVPCPPGSSNSTETEKKGS